MRTIHVVACLALMCTATVTLAKYESENETLRTDMKTLLADRDAKFDQVVQLSNDLNAAKSEFTNLQERQGQLAAELANRRRVMNAVGLSENADVDAIPPKVDGIVTAVNDTDLIEISIGFDDGLREGHKLDVYRGATFNLAHNFSQMLHLRPQNRFEEFDGMYLVGGGTHPGSGLPVIFESARISSDLLLRDLS